MNLAAPQAAKQERISSEISASRCVGSPEKRSVEPVFVPLTRLSQGTLAATMQQPKPTTIQMSDKAGALLGQLTLPTTTRIVDLEALRRLGVHSLGLVQMANTLGALSVDDLATLATSPETVGGAV